MTKVKDEETQVVATSADLANEGFEDEKLTIQSIPVLQLAQAQTPEVAEGATEGLHAGSLMNNVTKLPIGDTVEVLVYKMWDGRAKFSPRDAGGMIECWSPDGVTGNVNGECATCPFSGFDLKDKCLEQDCFIVGLADNPHEVYRLIFSKSNKRMGAKFKSMIASECRKAGRPIYGVKMLISTKRVKNEKASAYYYVFDVKPAGLVEEEALTDIRGVYLQMTEIRKSSLEDFKEYHKEKDTLGSEETGEETYHEEFTNDGKDLL